MANPLIKISNIKRDFILGNEIVYVLKGIDLQINKGEYVALMGPSGSGKSTLMNILGCLDTATSGSYILNNKDVSQMHDDELAEIRNEVVFDDELLSDKLEKYDWLHLHHEDFSGQYGKFFAIYRNAPWYIEQKKLAEELANKLGYKKVSEEKLAVAKKIRDFVIGGGFMFAMCSATDSFDIALAAEGVDICESMFDGDESEANYQTKIDYTKTFAFKNFILDRKPEHYEFSDIDMTEKRRIPFEKDYFTIMDYSAKWDPIPSMLCQNHTQLIKGFMGQTTACESDLIKSNILVMGTCELNGEARYIHGQKGKGMFTFYGGHDPEDYQHRVGDEPTVLDLHPNSPGFRLILNNVLFPAARKKKLKT